ncbi:hypothetical protein [Salinadaptatus halalkaliphilus]|uniref:hypothetical protein n=1 Tax=Salinadaptatus halalkaliphilus TaxID=2419781 RepID=UPI001143DA93|nr:hypothetical protein [Salinadaptatus halalkaliphilus]
MAKSLNPRIEVEIKEAVEELAGADYTMNETASKLIQIGVSTRKSGIEPEIKGPFGLPRPFAKIKLGDRMTELRTEVNDELADQLVDEFDNKPNTAAREALRLGLFTVANNEFEIKGPLGGPRPFAEIDLSGLNDPEVQGFVRDLRARL